MKYPLFPVSRRFLIVAGLVLATMAAAPAISAAQDLPLRGAGRGGPALGRGGGMFREAMARRLDLTTEQRESIAKIRQDGRARDLPLRKELRQLRHALRGEMMKDEPSAKAVTALAGQIGELRTRLQTGRLQDRLALRQVLTPQQRDELSVMGEGRRGRGRGRMGGGPRGGWDRDEGRGPGCDSSGPGPRHGQRGRDRDTD